MILAKVLSRVVSTEKLDHLPSRPYLCVEPLDGFGKQGDRLIAIDSVQSGPGDVVLVMQEGTGARELVLEESDAPLAAQAVVVAIVDDIQVN